MWASSGFTLCKNQVASSTDLQQFVEVGNHAIPCNSHKIGGSSRPKHIIIVCFPLEIRKCIKLSQCWVLSTRNCQLICGLVCLIFWTHTPSFVFETIQVQQNGPGTCMKTWQANIQHENCRKTPAYISSSPFPLPVAIKRHYPRFPDQTHFPKPIHLQVLLFLKSVWPTS